MLNCPLCGAHNVVGAIHCKKCRAELTRTCPNCGSKSKTRAKFCGDCGWPLTGAFSRTTKSLCARCHSPVDKGVPKCPSCGAELKWTV